MGSALRWDLKLSNVGKTPAKHIDAVYSVQIVSADQEVPLKCVGHYQN